MRRLTLLTLFLATVALLAACAQPEPVPTTKTYTETELADFMTGMSDDWESYTDPDLVTAVVAASQAPLNREGCPAVEAIFTFIPVRPGVAPQGLTTLAGTVLARGTYTYDAATDTCTRTAGADGDTLVLLYPYQNDKGTAEAELNIDWGDDTLDVAGRDGELVEVPTAMTATLTADDREVASLNAATDWYNTADCGNADGILEPTRVSLSGNLGSLGFDNVGYSLSDTNLTVQGAVTAGSDLSADLTVSLNGTLTRGPCFAEDFETDSGSLSFGAASSVDGDHSFRLSTGFSDIVLADDFMEDGFMGGGFMDDFTLDLRGVVSVRLFDGLVQVDGDTAATFDGVLDDENANGTPGENVTIEFSGGGSTTLEAYLRGYGFDLMPALPKLVTSR